MAANTSPRTGLVNALAVYPFVTAWDIGSTLAAIRCAYELELIDETRYRQRMTLVLDTLRQVPLFQGVAFNKNYSVQRGRMAGRHDRETDTGEGWSALDLGRLLLWLKIVAVRDPALAEAAAQVAGRIQVERVVRGGELWGSRFRADGSLEEYQEGRLGYEQYAARGFAAWGIPVAGASDPGRVGVPVRLRDRTLMADIRGRDRLTSEPFVLSGLEVGWTDAEATLARTVLAAQEDRFRRTGQVTMVSEDALPRPPYH